jgi:hypothetical protein
MSTSPQGGGKENFSNRLPNIFHCKKFQTQMHHPILFFFNRLPPLSVTLHFLREFNRKFARTSCSATL